MIISKLEKIGVMGGHGSVQMLICLNLLYKYASGTSIEGIRLVSNLKSGCDCSASRESLIYECTVMGGPGGATVWTGAALNCPSDEIVLLHGRFTQSDGTIRSCNHEATVAKSLYVNNNLYTSQLNITVTHDLTGRAIMCAYDAMGNLNNTNELLLSSIIPDLFPPPNNLHITTANFISKTFTFSWNPVSPGCPMVSYNIQASNCGSCPTTTNHTNITCTDIPINGSTCAFAVQSVICGNPPGNFSDLISVTTLNEDEISMISANATVSTTVGEEQNYNYSIMTTQRTPCTSVVIYSIPANLENKAFISSVLLAILFVIWVTISTTVIIILMCKIKHEQVTLNQGLPSPNSSLNVESNTVIDTSDNVAYGMFTRGRHYL